jgi:hypothetical protein
MTRALVSLLAVTLGLLIAPSPEADASYWRTCSPPRAVTGTMLTHRVNCVRARKVIWRLLVKSQTAQSPVVRSRGFTCRLRPAAERAIRCQRGTRRILSPLAG